MRRLLVILAFVPFVSFGEFDYDETLRINSVRQFYYVAFDECQARSAYSPRYYINSFDEFLSVFKAYKFGFKITINPSQTNRSIQVPTRADFIVKASAINASITNNVVGSTNGVGVVVSPMYFPRVAALYTLCGTLFANGYRGSGFPEVFSDRFDHCVNVDFSVLVSDILTSTNSTFSALLLQSLGQISSSIVNIDTGVSQLVPVVESVRDVNVNILSNSVSIVSNTLDIIDALIGDYPEEEPTRGMKGGAKGPYNDVRTSIKSQLQAWRNQATSQLQSWKTDLADQLQAWKTSDETGYLNIRKKLEDNFETKPPPGSSNTNNLPYTAFVTNQVVKVITNVVERSVAEGSAQISTNVQREAASTRRMLQDDLITPLFDPNGSGVNVNIKAPLWGQSQSAVHVHDSALDTFGVSVGASLDDMNEWLGDIYSLGADADNNWAAWFDRWDDFSDFTVGWYTDWWDLLSNNMDSFYSAFYTADGTRRMILELISNPEFRADVYQGLNWFQRVEYLLGFIANVSTGTVEVADIEDDLEAQGDQFIAAGTNLVSVSSDVVGLFDYVTRFSTSLRNAFQSSSAPVTEGITLLSGDSWFSADQPLVLRIDVNIQNALRLGCQCIWYLLAIVGIWLVVSWAWGKILAVCRWLWSMFDV